MEFPNERMNCSTCQHCYPYKKFNPVYTDSWEWGWCCVECVREKVKPEDRKYQYVLVFSRAPENEMCECWEERKDGEE